MAQETKKHNTPMVIGKMQKATELEHSRLRLNMDCNEVPPILHRSRPAPDKNRQL